MALPGTRENPVEVVSPRDLERATRHVRRPSRDQASAGNYQKAHVIVGGLHITIETPLDGVRRGTSPKGRSWQVSMPADYGYVKRTVGADGDSVDVYLGPQSHIAHRLPVWVIDQCDADTKRFDEHKCLVGFKTAEEARKTYHRGFSDGRGPDRVGAAARMSFEHFRRWLKTSDTKSPILYRRAKSASVLNSITHYGLQTDADASVFGGYMSDPTKTAVHVEKAASGDAGKIGSFTKWLSDVMKFVPQDQRASLFQDASVMSDAALAKASEHLEEGDDHEKIVIVDDLWDGNPDDRLETVRAHGPGSSVPGGKVGVGPGQAASGDGAEKMEREYSRHARQTGVQAATEMLGRDIANVKAAMKSIVAAVKGLQTQMTAMGGVTQTAALTPEVVKGMIDEAVAKAVAPFKAELTQIAKSQAALAIAKAEDGEEEEDKEAKEEESAKALDASVIKAEMDDEDEKEDDETAKSAAALRVQAKSRIGFVKQRLVKAIELQTAGDAKAASALFKQARFNIAKAETYAAAAKVVKGSAGLSLQLINRDIAKAKKSMADCEAENQDTWPNDGGKAAAVKPPAAPADLAKALDQIQKAAEGIGMMQASMSDVIGALSGGKAAPLDGQGNRLPPVFALAKAGADEISTREAELARLYNDNVITFDDLQASKDIINRARMGMPAEILKGYAERLPAAAQGIINRPLAA